MAGRIARVGMHTGSPAPEPLAFRTSTLGTTLALGITFRQEKLSCGVPSIKVRATAHAPPRQARQPSPSTRTRTSSQIQASQVHVRQSTWYARAIWEAGSPRCTADQRLSGGQRTKRPVVMQLPCPTRLPKPPRSFPTNLPSIHHQRCTTATCFALTAATSAHSPPLSASVPTQSASPS